jgi:UDP-glucose 6-dehydrogenase
VFCLDVDQAKIDLLNSGGVLIYEPGLKEVIERKVEAGRCIPKDVQALIPTGREHSQNLCTLEAVNHDQKPCAGAKGD